MKGDSLVLRFGSGILIPFWFLLSPVLRAEDATPEKSPSTIVKNDPGKEGMPSAETKATVKGSTGTRKFTKAEFKLKLLREQFDGNGDGQLDDGEKKKMDAYLAMMAEKYKQALTKYDANKNGVLDPDEKQKMKQAEALADSNERQRAAGEARTQQKIQQMMRAPPPRDFTPRTQR